LIPGQIWALEQLQGVFYVAVPIRKFVVKIEGGLLLQGTEILTPQRGETAPAERMVGWRGLGCAYRLGPVTYTWGAAAWVASKKAPKHAAALRDMETATEGSEE
jgi:hypothetical protein